jgi:hypothetical protein
MAKAKDTRLGGHLPHSSKGRFRLCAVLPGLKGPELKGPELKGRFLERSTFLPGRRGISGKILLHRHGVRIGPTVTAVSHSEDAGGKDYVKTRPKGSCQLEENDFYQSAQL